jgi:ribosome maturation factor RimP
MASQEPSVRRSRARPLAAIASVIEATVSGMGYDLADCEFVQRGRLIRVFIDRLDFPAEAPAGGPQAHAPAEPPLLRVTVEDCERVTRQLQRVFEVEGIDYERLEVSSPGMDRVLRTAAQFRRFTGQEIEVRLRVPLLGRRRFVGLLSAADEAGVEMRVDGVDYSFALADLEKARLVPKF